MYMLKEDGEEMSLTQEQRNFLVDMGLIKEHGADYVITRLDVSMTDIENHLMSMGMVG